MFIDALSVPTVTVIETEVCIVGAGAAGISLAHEFTNSGFRVVLLESAAPNLKRPRRICTPAAILDSLITTPESTGVVTSARSQKNCLLMCLPEISDNRSLIL